MIWARKRKIQRQESVLPCQIWDNPLPQRWEYFTALSDFLCFIQCGMTQRQRLMGICAPKLRELKEMQISQLLPLHLLLSQTFFRMFPKPLGEKKKVIIGGKVCREKTSPVSALILKGDELVSPGCSRRAVMFRGISEGTGNLPESWMGSEQPTLTHFTPFPSLYF